MIPIDVIPERTPLCSVVSFKSHSATGNTKLIPENDQNVLRAHFKFHSSKVSLPIVSYDVAVMIIPAMNMRI